MAFIPIQEVPERKVNDASSEAESSEGPALAELRGIIAHFPDGLGAFDQMYARMVGQGRLEHALRLVILGAAARWRSDGYIAGAMFSEALAEGVDGDELAALIAEAEGDGPTTAEGALLSFCRKATQTAFRMVQGDIDRLRPHGWTNGQIVEAVTMVSLSGYMTAISAAGGLLDDPNLEPEPWR